MNIVFPSLNIDTPGSNVGMNNYPQERTKMRLAVSTAAVRILPRRRKKNTNFPEIDTKREEESRPLLTQRTRIPLARNIARASIVAVTVVLLCLIPLCCASSVVGGRPCRGHHHCPGDQLCDLALGVGQPIEPTAIEVQYGKC